MLASSATSSLTMWSVPGDEASAARTVAVDGKRQVAKTVLVGFWRSWRVISRPIRSAFQVSVSTEWSRDHGKKSLPSDEPCCVCHIERNVVSRLGRGNNGRSPWTMVKIYLLGSARNNSVKKLIRGRVIQNPQRPRPNKI